MLARSSVSQHLNRECFFHDSNIQLIQDQGPRVLWQGPSWRLVTHKLILPGGSTVERAAIEHPGAVVLIPLRETNGNPEVLMLRQYRFAVGETVFELPAGTRGWDEEWLDCAQRELREETGYRAKNFKSLGEVWPAPGLSNEIMRLYLVSELSPDPLPADTDEMIQLQPMPLDELVLMAQDGRVRDAKSIVGLLRADLHLRSK